MDRSPLWIVIAGLAAWGASATAEVARQPPPTKPSAGSASVPAGAGGATLRPPERSRSQSEPSDMPMPDRPPIPPAPPTPAPEIAALGKQLTGTWQCKGNTMRGNGSSSPLAAKLTVKLDLDNAWIVASLAETTGPMKWIEYRTFDGVAKQWTKVQLANTSGRVISTSTGEAGGKWTWTGTAVSPLGSVQLREFEQRDGKSMKLWGEALLGGTWQKAYEVSCKK